MSSTTLDPPQEAPTTRKLREQTRTVKEDVAELGRLTREASREKLATAREVGSDWVEKGRDKAKAAEDSVVNYVHEKPVKSVLLAAGAGVLIGFLLRHR